MSKSTKDFVAIVDLKEGEHQYKFLVDGEWISSNTEPQVKSPDGSTLNNIIKVQKEDFDAYHALDMDSKAVALSQQNNKKRMFSDAFGQEIPQFSNVPGENRSGPPILPPHLLQVILNKVKLECTVFCCLKKGLNVGGWHSSSTKNGTTPNRSKTSHLQQLSTDAIFMTFFSAVSTICRSNTARILGAGLINI